MGCRFWVKGGFEEDEEKVAIFVSCVKILKLKSLSSHSSSTTLHWLDHPTCSYTASSLSQAPGVIGNHLIQANLFPLLTRAPNPPPPPTQTSDLTPSPAPTRIIPSHNMYPRWTGARITPCYCHLTGTGLQNLPKCTLLPMPHTPPLGTFPPRIWYQSPSNTSTTPHNTLINHPSWW